MVRVHTSFRIMTIGSRVLLSMNVVNLLIQRKLIWSMILLTELLVRTHLLSCVVLLTMRVVIMITVPNVVTIDSIGTNALVFQRICILYFARDISVPFCKITFMD